MNRRVFICLAACILHGQTDHGEKSEKNDKMQADNNNAASYSKEDDMLDSNRWSLLYRHLQQGFPHPGGGSESCE